MEIKQILWGFNKAEQKQCKRSSVTSCITNYRYLPQDDMTPCTAALIKWGQAQHMSSVTWLRDQPRRPASSCYQPPFNCMIKWKFRAAPLVTYKAEVTFKKAKTTTLKLIMEKSVLGAKSISKHRLNEGSDNSVSLLLIAQVKQMQLNQNPCFLAPPA